MESLLLSHITKLKLNNCSNPGRQYLLKQMPIGRLGANGQLAGMAWIYTPFSTPDLLNWRSTEPPYKEDPLRMESLFASIFISHNSAWLDLQQMPNTKSGGWV